MFFKAVKTKQQKYCNIFFISFKQKERLLLIPENTGDRVFSVHKTKYKMFQELNISNVSVFMINCQSNNDEHNNFILLNKTVQSIST